MTKDNYVHHKGWNNRIHAIKTAKTAICQHSSLTLGPQHLAIAAGGVNETHQIDSS